MALRTVEDYFIICTLGMGVILFSVMNNWMELTRGPLGIPGIPPVSFFGHELSAKWEWVLLAGDWRGWWSVPGAPGRGKNAAPTFRMSILGTMLAAVPGALYAHHVSFIDRTSFTIHESIFILSIIIIGGLGNLWGSLAAAAFMILVPEALRFVGLPSAVAANVRQMLHGAALVAVIWFGHSRNKKERPIPAAPSA